MTPGAKFTPADMRYSVDVDGITMVALDQGQPLSGALAEVAKLRAEHPGAQITLAGVAYGDDDISFGISTVTLSGDSEGRLVGFPGLDVVTIEDADHKGLTLLDVEWEFEPFISTDPDFEGSLDDVAQALRDMDITNVGEVYARPGTGPDTFRVTVDLTENFLWDADARSAAYIDKLHESGDEEAALEAAAEELTDNSDILDAVFTEWYGEADIEVPDDWDSARVTIGVDVKRDRFTNSLVVDDLWPKLVKFKNETDPGTFGSPYIMAEVHKRIEQRNLEREEDGSA